MSLLDAVQRIRATRPERFVAPLFEGRNTVLIMQEGVPFRIGTPSLNPGWWVLDPFKVRNGWASRMVRAAYPGEYLEYLDLLPRWYVVLIHRLGESTWLCIPANQGDAHQRGWELGAPQALHLVRDMVQLGDLVEARQLGPRLLYAQMPLRQVSVPGATAFQAAEIYDRYKVLLQEKQAELERQELLSSTEGQIKDQVEFLGAKLLAWNEVGERYEVTFEWQGRQVRTFVNRELAVESVGFCTAGTDSQHTLASIVGLLQHGVQQDHYAVRRLSLDDDFWHHEED